MRTSTIELIKERHKENPFVVSLRPMGVLWVSDTRGTFEFEVALDPSSEAWHELELPEGLAVSVNVWQDDVVPWVNDWHCKVYPVAVHGLYHKVDTSVGVSVVVKEG
jgi:streptogramin lyase